MPLISILKIQELINEKKIKHLQEKLEHIDKDNLENYYTDAKYKSLYSYLEANSAFSLNNE